MTIENKDINSIDNIYKTVYNINNQMETIANSSEIAKVFPIIFSDDVKFVFPLFLSLLLITHDRYRDKELLLVIDIIDLQKTKQHHVLRMLLQNIDMPYFELINDAKHDDVTNDFIPKEPDATKREQGYQNRATGIYGDPVNPIYNSYRRSITKSDDRSEAVKVFLYHAVAHKDSIFCEKGSPFVATDSGESASYRHLMPIFKISNFPLFAKDDVHYEENKIISQDIASHVNIRKAIYEKMLITGSNYDKDAIGDMLSKMLPYIRPTSTSPSLDKAFKTIFLELIDNVKRHAASDTNSDINSYFNFYYDRVAKEFRFLIIDDAKQGFLNRYMETLKKELEELEKIQPAPQNNEITNSFREEINSLESDMAENDKQILRNLFSLDGHFTAHQIPRIVMHFGIPILTEYIKDLGGTFYIRLHRVNQNGECRFYELQIDNDRNLNIKEVAAGIEGTYLYIAIPSSGKPKNIEAKPLDPPTQEYSYILKTDQEINDKISKFKTVDEVIKDKNADKQVIFDYKKYISKYPENSISDTLRNIYKIAYTKKFDDILVINFPLALNMSYMNILVNMLYKEDHPLVSRYPVNVIYYDNLTHDMLFIGGKNQAEFCGSNHIIKTKYTSDKEYPEAISAICNDSYKMPAKSAFFYQDNQQGEWHILPMSNFKQESASEDYFKGIKKQDLHVEVNEEYHVGRFFDLKDTINDSLKDKRIAYYFASKIKKGYPNQEVVFIGVGKSSAITISRMQIILDQDKDKEFFTYSKNIDDKQSQCTKLKEFIERNTSSAIIVFAPVIASMQTIKEFFECLEGAKITSIKKIFNTIRLQTDGTPIDEIKKIQIESFLTIDRNEMDLREANSCKYCFPANPKDEKPLYRLNATGYRPENYYEENFDVKNVSNKYSLSKIKWQNMICTGHIEKSNHYYYYLKTIKLLENNRKNIIEWLSKKINKVNESGRNIILSPMRSTNNKFIILVEKELFKGDAAIYRFDRKEFDENLYNLQGINIRKEDNVYFVDDEVDTGVTIEYFYGILQKATGYSNKKFTKIITLLDRTSKKDNDILLNFIEDKNSYHYFLSVSAQPIKTHEERCFLCDRRKYYIDLFRQCTIDLTRFQFLERIVKLQDTSVVDLKENIGENSIKNFIKLYMVEEMLKSNNFQYPNKKLTSIIELIKNEHEDDIDEIRSKLNDSEFKRFDKCLKKSIRVELRIAYYKALSFPRIVYNEEARKVITGEVIVRLENQVENDDYGIFSKDQIDSFKDIKKILDDKKISNTVVKFVAKERKKIDMVNILFSTAGYLDIKYLLSKKVIEFYHNIFSHEDNSGIKSKMHTYPFAVKMITTARKSSAKKFDDNLTEFLGDNLKTFKMDKFTKLRAMYLENIKAKNDKFNVKETEDIEKLKKALLSYVGNNSINKIQISVNQKYNIEYDTLAKYMLDSSLVDLSSYALMDRAKFEKEYMVYNGIISEEKNGKKIPTSIKYTTEDHGGKQESARLNDIWANWYIEEENRIIFRLVDIDDRRLHIENRGKCIEDFSKHLEDFLDQTKAVVPIGVMSVALEANANIAEITRKLLVANKEIVAYMKKKFSTGVIQEAIRLRELNYYLNFYDHNIGHALNLRGAFENQIYIPFNNRNSTQEKRASSLFGRNIPQTYSYIDKLEKGVKNFYNYLYAPPRIVRVAQLPLVSKKENYGKEKDIDIFKFFENKDEYSKSKVVDKIRDALLSMSEVVDLIPQKTEINIEYSKTKEFVFYGIEKEDLEAIIFEFCYNAARRTKKILMLSFSTDENGCLLIKNNVDSTDEIRFEKKARGGRESIEKFLLNIGYKIFFPKELTDDKYIIKICRSKK